MKSPERQQDQLHVLGAPAPEHLKLLGFRITSCPWANSLNWHLHTLGYIGEELKLVKIPEAVNELTYVAC